MNGGFDILENAWATILVLLFFGGSIFVHELGHFLAAKWRGLKITRFSIGFGPILFSWKGRDGCEYAVSLLPLGGYVALPQLAEMGAIEGTDASDSAGLPKISCFDKIVVSAAGAFFNIITAAVLAAVVWIFGLPVSSSEATTTIGYVAKTISGADGKTVQSPADKCGLKAGDEIVAIDSVKVSDFSQIIERIAIGSGRTADGAPSAEIEILRNGRPQKITVLPELITTNTAAGDAIRMIGIYPAATMKIGKIMPDSPAARAGLEVGDIVAGIDGKKLFSNMQLSDILSAVPLGSPVNLEILRGGEKRTIKILPEKVALTKPLCKITLPADAGTVSFVAAASKSADSSETVRVLAVNADGFGGGKIAVGDILYEIAMKKVDSLSQLNAIINTTVGSSGARMYFSDDSMNLKSAYLPPNSKSEILPPQEKMMLGYYLENIVIVRHPSIVEQFADSIERTYSAIASLANPRSDVGFASLAGPVDIGRVIYRLSLTDISLMLSFAVLLNINLAILNMLPIPVLDGGHILFALIERVRGKALPRSFFVAVQSIFSLAFIGLMAYVVYLGFLRWNGDAQSESAAEKISQYYVENITFKK